MILLAFIGLILGSPYSLLVFVDEAHASYLQGWSAQELVDSLDDDQFRQTGGIVPIKAGNDAELAEKINGLLVARCLSLAYMTWAFAGVPFPARSEKEAWAWSDALGTQTTGEEASSWAALVRSTMKLEAARLSEEVADLVDKQASSRSKTTLFTSKPAGDGPAAGDGVQSSGGRAYIEDPNVQRTSPTVSLLKRQTAIIKAALTLVEQQWWLIYDYLPTSAASSPAE